MMVSVMLTISCSVVNQQLRCSRPSVDDLREGESRKRYEVKKGKLCRTIHANKHEYNTDLLHGGLGGLVVDAHEVVGVQLGVEPGQLRLVGVHDVLRFPLM